MEDQIHSPKHTSRSTLAHRPYETTYRREYILKRSPSDVEGIPLGQQFPISSPYRLDGPIGASIYTVDYSKDNKVCREEFPRPNTSRANRPHPHQGFPFWPRRAESLIDLSVEETEQALKNQLNSTYRADFTGNLTWLEFISVESDPDLSRSSFRSSTRIPVVVGLQTITSALARACSTHAG